MTMSHFLNAYKLTVLDFNSNFIASINDLHLFDSLDMLESLFYIFCLDDARLFSSLVNLDQLDLSSNRLSFLNENILCSYKKLTSLALKNNELSGKLKTSLFKELINLRGQFLSVNQIDE